jgi:hypothetical protein
MEMGAERIAGVIVRRRALILVAAGGAVAEAGLLTLFAPAARALAPQVTALPVLAAYHDLRWLFADDQSWITFTGVLIAVLAARAGMDTLLLRLAWPTGTRPAPRAGRVFVSCLALTALAWILLTPAATLALGVAVLPFSWPLIAALPIMLGMMLALSHGGTVESWWRRLPPLRAVGWLAASFVALSVAGGVIAHAGTGEAIAVCAAAGLVNARAWYGIAAIASRMQPRPLGSIPSRVVLGLPFAPIAALLVLVLVVGVARLMFTGTISIGGNNAPSAIAASGGLNAGGAGTGSGAGGSGDGSGAGVSGSRLGGTSMAAASAGTAAKAVLVVGGWGSACCHAGDALSAVVGGMVVRQFSYAGLNAKGQPLPSGADDDDIPLPEMGDMLATQLTALHNQVHGPVDVVAESEGTLGVYAMMDRHPGLPLGSVVLLSPIVAPGQVSYPADAEGLPVPEYALITLNHLVGGMSPYGPAGAGELLSSVGEFGARYFDHVAAATGQPVRWLAVIPLADALTLPVCALPQDVVVVPAFHGGLLGDTGVLPMVSTFLAGRPAVSPAASQSKLKTEAELITGGAAAWRMPQTTEVCP